MAIRSYQQPTWAIKGYQELSGAISSHQELSEAIESYQQPSGAIGRYMKLSGGIKSWILQDSQLSWEYKVEPSVAITISGSSLILDWAWQNSAQTCFDMITALFCWDHGYLYWIGMHIWQTSFIQQPSFRLVTISHSQVLDLVSIFHGQLLQGFWRKWYKLG